MKILFLDIDGVLNTRDFLLKSDGLELDPENIKWLQYIIEMTQCHVVLSSSWRYNPEWRTILKDVCEFLDCTPTNNGLSSRGTEIKQWLDEHEGITRFACIDDDKDFHADQKLFVTDFLTEGLNQKIAEEVISYFNESEKKEKKSPPSPEDIMK